MDEEAVNSPVAESFQETLSKGNELIDATQNAIIDAAENVTGIFDAAAAKTVASEAHLEPFYTEIEFWVGMAFVLSVIVLLKPLFLFIRSALQRRIQNVAQAIDDAVKLRDDAQILLADYERKYQNAAKEAQEIIDNSRISLERFKKTELANLQESLKLKEKEAERRIKTSTAKVQNEINSSASVLSVQLAQKAIQKYLKETDQSRLIDDAIDELDKFIA
ncbi:MAG: hypothetical protein VZR95_01575 [Alphaproteobacteria bacterium]